VTVSLSLLDDLITRRPLQRLRELKLAALVPGQRRATGGGVSPMVSTTRSLSA